MDKKSINLLIILGTLIAIAVMIYFIILPSFLSLSNSKEILQEQENEYTQTKNQLNEIKGNENYYQELAKKLNKTYELLPIQKDIDNFVIQLDEIAKRNGSVLEIIKITTPKETKTLKQNGNKTNSSTVEPTKPAISQTIKQGNFYVIPFEITMKNNFYSLFNYLSSMEIMNRFVNLNELDAKVNQDNNLDVKLGGVIYVKPE
jgi:Tfp pilus assembly protein PilO